MSRCVKLREEPMSAPVFVQLRCKPGSAYRVAEAIIQREVHSELYSTSGEHDLLLKLYIPDDAEIGHYINENLLDIVGIERSLTTLTFRAF
jgi:DNA-binding Lrp family transcriptional regulator